MVAERKRTNLPRKEDYETIFIKIDIGAGDVCFAGTCHILCSGVNQ